MHSLGHGDRSPPSFNADRLRRRPSGSAQYGMAPHAKAVALASGDVLVTSWRGGNVRMFRSPRLGNAAHGPPDIGLRRFQLSSNFTIAPHFESLSVRAFCSETNQASGAAKHQL
jgi:hypothetical protein